MMSLESLTRNLRNHEVILKAKGKMKAKNVDKEKNHVSKDQDNVFEIEESHEEYFEIFSKKFQSWSTFKKLNNGEQVNKKKITTWEELDNFSKAESKSDQEEYDFDKKRLT
jgi:hypothetical protein